MVFSLHGGGGEIFLSTALYYCWTSAALQKEAFILGKNRCLEREGKSWWSGGAGQGGQHHRPQQGLWGVIAAHRDLIKINLIKELQSNSFILRHDSVQDRLFFSPFQLQNTFGSQLPKCRMGRLSTVLWHDIISKCRIRLRTELWHDIICFTLWKGLNLLGMFLVHSCFRQSFAFELQLWGLSAMRFLWMHL